MAAHDGSSNASVASLASQISDAMTALQRQHYGKGPRHVRTTIDRDAVVVVMRGGFTAVETTLHEHGMGSAVLEQRTAFQQVMHDVFCDVVATILGRPVEAMLSANHQDPDVMVEVFLLDDAP